MNYIKRFAATTLIAALLSALAPIPVGAQITHSNVSVTRATTTFDPSSGQIASINYSVLGPDTAENMIIRVYRASPTVGSRQCNNLSQLFAAQIEGPVNREVGNYTATWTGRAGNSSSGTILPSNLYCYQLVWDNPPWGATPLAEGQFTLNATPASGGGTGTGGTGTGTGGTGTGGGTTNGGTGNGPVQKQGIITASVDPYVINPNATEGNAAYISYRVNQNLAHGFTLKIYDSGGFVVKDLYATNGFIPAGTSATVSWNGRWNNYQVVGQGDYFYKFRVGGTDVATGLIRVEYSSGSSGTGTSSNADIIHYVVPTTIDPTTTPPQIATIYYTVRRTIYTGLTISVRDAVGFPVKTLMSTDNIIYPGAYYTSWDGKFNNGNVVPQGTYRYVLISNNQQISSALIHVQYGAQPVTPPPPSGPFISSHSAAPQTFNPGLGQTTTISYTLGRNVNNFKLSIRNQSAAEIITLETATNKAFGSYSNVWTAANALPGQYNYVFEAAGLTPVFGTVFVTANGSATAPVITDLGPDPATFVYGGSTTFRYQLSQNACVDLTVLSGAATVRRLQTCSLLAINGYANQVNQIVWDGRDNNGVYVNPGTYTYVIEARNTNGTAASRSGTVSITSTGGALVDVTNVYASPNPFNADTQNTLLYFTLNRDAYVTITLRRPADNTFIRTFSANQLFSTGSHSVSWNGTDQGNLIVGEGIYEFRVDASNATYGSDSATANVEARRTTGNNYLVITEHDVNPDRFYPRSNERANIDFRLNRNPDSKLVRIYRTNDSTFVREIPVLTLGTNFYRAEWNGKDQYGNYAADGTYTYRIDASAGGYNAQTSGTVYVGSSTGGGTDGDADCGNFWDVPDNHRLCEAIDFVANRGIFVGYSDGSLGLDKVIRRAELLAVIQKAFQYPLETYNASRDRHLGYSDLRDDYDEWYMPYIKTFKNLGIMVGYPDGRMRPERTMSTAELYVSFLKAAVRSPRDIANFTLPDRVQHAPFIDTPITNDTLWYIKYAMFAKLNDLVTTERFYPARGITRGQVIQLIYDTHRKGLIEYPTAN